MALVV